VKERVSGGRLQRDINGQRWETSAAWTQNTPEAGAEDLFDIVLLQIRPGGLAPGERGVGRRLRGEARLQPPEYGPADAKTHQR
jgi:hypothetical protein